MSVFRPRIAFKILIAPVLCSAAAHPSIAQEADASQLEEVRVWGTEVKASSLMLGEDVFAIKQADHISDLLRTIPGVDVGGAHSLNQRITIRSMDDKDLRITIDGANQNTYMYHHLGNLYVNADILESAEIEIGTNSVVNGGLGGAVRFKTKSADQLLSESQSFGGLVKVSHGDNFGTSATLTGYGAVGESFDFLGYYNALERDNYEVGGGKILGADGSVVAGTDGTVRGLEGERSNALVKLGWNVTPEHRVELGYETYSDEGDYSYRPDMGLATDLAITESLGIPLLWPTELTRDTVTLNYESAVGDNTSIDAAIFQTTSNLERDESGWAENEAFAAFAGIVEGEATNSGANILAESEFGSHQLTYGVEYINYDTDYSAIYPAGTNEASSENATNAALFVQDRIQLNESFALIPGVRHETYDLESTVVDDTFSDTLFSIAGEFQFNDHLLAKLSTTQLFKGPEIGEVFTGAGLYDSANPGIEAETGTNTEFSMAFSDASLNGASYSAGFTVFKTDVDGYIYDYALINDEYTKDNVGDMEITGFELYAGYDYKQFSGLLTFSSAESDLDAFAEHAEFDGARLDRQQGDTISLNIDYRISDYDLTLHWDVLMVGDVDAGVNLDGATLDNAKDDYTVHNISALWSPASLNGVELALGVDNLFDEFYASQSSRTGESFHPRFGSLYLVDYEPGRNIKLTASYSF